MKKKNMRKLTIRLEEEYFEAIKELAGVESLSSTVRKILKEYILLKHLQNIENLETKEAREFYIARQFLK